MRLISIKSTGNIKCVVCVRACVRACVCMCVCIGANLTPDIREKIATTFYKKARAAVTEAIDLAADGAHRCQSSLIMTMIRAYIYQNTFTV